MEWLGVVYKIFGLIVSVVVGISLCFWLIRFMVQEIKDLTENYILEQVVKDRDARISYLEESLEYERKMSEDRKKLIDDLRKMKEKNGE